MVEVTPPVSPAPGSFMVCHASLEATILPKTDYWRTEAVFLDVAVGAMTLKRELSMSNCI